MVVEVHVGSAHLAGDGDGVYDRSRESVERFIPVWLAGKSKADRGGDGYAILEAVVMRDGRMANNQLTNYIIPTTLDTPDIDVVLLENPYPRGPFVRKASARCD